MHKNPIETNASELKDIISAHLSADRKLNYALKIVGHPGIGKSSIVKQIAEEKNFFFIDTRLAFKENIDLGGYPVPDHKNQKMIYYRPKFIPPETVPEGYNGIVWFLDESNRAHPTVIQTLFQIITESRCGEHLLPEKTNIILAGNLGEDDMTTITDFDDAALDGRLAIFHLKPKARDWLVWAAHNNIHPAVIEYISLFPERLWDEKDINPNPRGWHQASNALSNAYMLKTKNDLKNALLSEKRNVLEKIISSLVGEIAAYDFITEIISPRKIATEDIISGDEKKLEQFKNNEIPSEDILWGITGSISEMNNIASASGGDLKSDDLLKLANILNFISLSRSDNRIAFFQILLRECGLLTKIPQAVNLMEDKETRQRIKSRFTEIFELE
ncbi:MAG: ATP-binding protein [Thermodesulfobacteriota bacterium]